MQTIFEREARREKNLEIAKKLATDDKKGPAAKKGTADPEKLKKQAEEKLAEDLKKIEEGFFKHVADDDNDLDVIKARGEM